MQAPLYRVSLAPFILCYAISRICRNLQPSSYCLLSFFFRDRRDLLQTPAFLTSGKGESNRIHESGCSRAFDLLRFVSCELSFGDFKYKMAVLCAIVTIVVVILLRNIPMLRTCSQSLISERRSVTPRYSINPAISHTYCRIFAF